MDAHHLHHNHALNKYAGPAWRHTFPGHAARIALRSPIKSIVHDLFQQTLKRVHTHDLHTNESKLTYGSDNNAAPKQSNTFEAGNA